jgi:hypothetical protein
MYLQVRSNILRALGDLGFLFPKTWIEGGPGRAKLAELLSHVIYNTSHGPAKVGEKKGGGEDAGVIERASSHQQFHFTQQIWRRIGAMERVSRARHGVEEPAASPARRPAPA